MKCLKRLLPLFLVLSMLSGCGKRVDAPLPEKTISPEAPQTSSPMVTAEPTEEPISEQELSQRLFVRYAEERKDYRAETTNDLLLSYSCRTPVVELPGLEKQEGAINAALASLSESFRQGAAGSEGDGLEALLAAAASDYGFRSAEGNADYFPPYAYERDGSVVRGDGTVLSILFSHYINRGGVHGGTYWQGVSFDPESGSRLSLSDLAEDTEALRSICIAEIRTQCDQMSDLLFDDYAEHVEELFTDGLWYLNDSGLVFVANEYHLAPYAAGALSFTVKYRALRGVLQERYLLPSRNDVQGGIELFRAGDVELGKEPLLSLQSDEYGEQLVFRSNNSVYNVRLFLVGYDESCGSFYQTRELAYLSALRDGECFQIQRTIPDVLPDLQLSWRLPDGSSQKYLVSQSGEDGSLFLLEPNTLRRIQPGELAEDYLLWDLDGNGQSESLMLELDGVWKLKLMDTETLMAETRYSAERPKVFVADVDEDEHCEVFLECENTLSCWRYDGTALQSVFFILKGEAVPELNATVLQAGVDGLHLSCNIPLMGTKQAAQALFRDGPDGTLSLAYDTEWDFFTHGTLTLRDEITCTNGTVLPAGAVITPAAMNDKELRFTDAMGNTLLCELACFP